MLGKEVAEMVASVKVLLSGLQGHEKWQSVNERISNKDCVIGVRQVRRLLVFLNQQHKHQSVNEERDSSPKLAHLTVTSERHSISTRDKYSRK
ncbi:uncharacterized [Tachysurus ichikawai]